MVTSWHIMVTCWHIRVTHCNEILAHCDDILAHYGDILARCNDILAHCDDILANCGEVLAHCDDLLAHCDDLLAHCVDLLVHCDDLLAHCDDLLVHCDDLLAHCDDLLAHCDDVSLTFLRQVASMYSKALSMMSSSVLRDILPPLWLPMATCKQHYHKALGHSHIAMPLTIAVATDVLHCTGVLIRGDAHQADALSPDQMVEDEEGRKYLGMSLLPLLVW